MRRITAGLFASVDGVVEAPNLCQFDSFDSELVAGMARLMETVTTAVLGRHGYEEWSSYWPQAPADDAFGAFINPIEKLGASTTLTGELDWNATLIEGDVVDALADLKRSDGGDIGVFASISLARELLFAGVLDELTLMIHPVVACACRRLFEPSDPVTRMELRRADITSAGNALLTYALRDGGS